jgi:uroporphyrinogen III methyltransferase/synthase
MSMRRPTIKSEDRTPVALIGAGPGDPGLVTTKGRELLDRADVIVADPEIPTALFKGLAAEVLPADDEAAAACVARARLGDKVVRLYTGDVFTANGAADIAALNRAKVGFEVVPGIPAAVGVPAYAGIALGQTRTIATVDTADWAALATAPGAVVLIGVAADAGKAAAALIEHGRKAETPVAVTIGGTTTDQKTVTGTLEGAEALVADLTGSAVIVVGDVIKGRERQSWWESRPLFGWTVLVPRTREQAGPMADLLAAAGARSLEVPTIAVEPPRTPAPMERAIKGLVSGRYQWIAFTSGNAVRAIREKLDEYGLDARAFAGVKVAAVGEVTAETLRAYGIRPDLVPSGQHSSEGLLADWPDYDDLLDPIDRVLLPRADIATETLVAGLKDRGWAVDDVTAYRTVRAAPPPAPIREALKGGRVDAVLFTSSSTVRNLVGIAGKPHDVTVLGAIGPQTAATMRDLGLRVDVQADESTVPALVAALAEHALERRAADNAQLPSSQVRQLRSRRR